MTTWFSADTHYEHLNIIPFCGRPFRSLLHMEEELIANWNARVKPEDTAWHLGDLILGPSSKQEAKLREILPQLNGTKNFIKGNHDGKGISFYERVGFAHVDHAYYFKSDVLLIHNPDKAQHYFGKGPNPRVVLCGHVHDMWITQVRDGILYVNVGVDVRRFAPVSAEELGV